MTYSIAGRYMVRAVCRLGGASIISGPRTSYAGEKRKGDAQCLSTPTK